jgi:cytochrome P450
MVDYNPKLPAVMADPFPVLRRLQMEDPVHWSPILRSWVLTRYDDVRASLNDPRLSADRITPFLKHQARPPAALQEICETVGLWAVFTDPPAHTRLRAIMQRALGPRTAEYLRPEIQKTVDVLIDRVHGHGRLELIGDFAYPLPITVIAGLIGVPPEDRDRFRGWSEDLAAFVGSAVANPDKYERAAASVRAMRGYFRRLAALRRASPRSDLMTTFALASETGDALSDDELEASCILLLFAGHETTTNLVSNGIVALLRNPEQCEAWRCDPTLTPSAVEELLRYDGPGQALVRVATEDLELRGERIKRGDRVFLMINAANRDPGQFENPDRLDLGRQNNHHLTFGYGIHFCLGAPLARIEAQLAIPALLGRLPSLRLATDRLDWIDSLVFRRVTSLPLSFRAS